MEFLDEPSGEAERKEFFAETSAKRLSTYGAQESGRAERKTNGFSMKTQKLRNPKTQKLKY